MLQLEVIRRPAKNLQKTKNVSDFRLSFHSWK